MSTSPHPEGMAQASHAPTAAPAAVQYYYPPPPPRRGFWGRLLISLFVLVFMGSLFMNLMLAGVSASLLTDGSPRVQEKFVSHNQDAKDKVAILPIEGVILESDDGFVKRAIDTVTKDEHVKALVLRVDSPGGSVTGSDYIYHHLCKLAESRKIPIVVSMGSIAASGGYYVSMAVGHTPNTIFAEPTGFTGSIGVIIPHYNVAGLLDNKIEDDSIASNPLKKMGGIMKPMSTQEKKIFQALVDESFAHFKAVVKSGREKFEKNPDLLDKLATGQIYTAEQAVAPENGLVDQLGFIEDAVDRAIELANLDKSKVKVVRYKAEPSLSSMLLGGQAHSAASIDLKTLLDMTTPRAYYLASWMPALAGAEK